jgi:hypothetical protein
MRCAFFFLARHSAANLRITLHAHALLSPGEKNTLGNEPRRRGFGRDFCKRLPTNLAADLQAERRGGSASRTGRSSSKPVYRPLWSVRLTSVLGFMAANHNII